MLTSIAYAADAPPPRQGSLVDMIIPVIFMVAVFYFLIIRPNKKQMQKKEQMLTGLKPGDTVITTGGIYGQILSIRGEVVTIDSTDKGRLKIAKRAIVETVNPSDLEEKG